MKVLRFRTSLHTFQAQLRASPVHVVGRDLRDALLACPIGVNPLHHAADEAGHSLEPIGGLRRPYDAANGGLAGTRALAWSRGIARGERNVLRQNERIVAAARATMKAG